MLGRIPLISQVNLATRFLESVTGLAQDSCDSISQGTVTVVHEFEAGFVIMW